MELPEFRTSEHLRQHATDSHDGLKHSHAGVVRALRMGLVAAFAIVALVAFSNTCLYLIK